MNATILRLPEVCDRLSLSRSTIWNYVRLGKFPKPIAISDKNRGWLSTDIDQYIAERQSAPHHQ